MGTCIWIIIIVVVVVGLFYMYRKNVENFHTYYGYFKSHCNSCTGKSPEAASKCSNCGLCLKNDSSVKSVEGSSDGPFFADDCLQYSYSSPYFYYPYSYIYPVNLTRTSFPSYPRTIRHQYRWIRRLPNN
jgi:hypothetical protein